MFRKLWIVLAIAAAAAPAPAQERRARIHVDHYVIDAEVQPRTQSLIAKATVRFVPLDDNINSVSFELNNALNVSRVVLVVDGKEKQIPASRSQQDFSVRLSFDEYLAKGQPVQVTLNYDGHLTGNEDSPVYGIKFAAIHDDYAFLMYPARWFPINGYTTARFSAEMNITVPSGYKVLAPGIEASQPQGDKVVSNFKFDHPSFPGSIAVVKDTPVRVNSEGVTTTIYFRDTEKS